MYLNYFLVWKVVIVNLKTCSRGFLLMYLEAVTATKTVKKKRLNNVGHTFHN